MDLKKTLKNNIKDKNKEYEIIILFNEEIIKNKNILMDQKITLLSLVPKK